MTYFLGLTGGIGMGKSTASQMFRDRGHPVWDADAAVHRLYAVGGAAVAPLARLFPDAIRDGAVDRAALKALLQQNPADFPRLEAVVHPLIQQDRADFIAQHGTAPLIVFDIPLLFENGLDAQMSGSAVVSTDAATQRARVLARPGMTEADFNMIKARQMPDADKRARADWIIPSDSLSSASAAIDQLCEAILSNA